MRRVWNQAVICRKRQVTKEQVGVREYRDMHHYYHVLDLTGPALHYKRRELNVNCNLVPHELRCPFVLFFIFFLLADSSAAMNSIAINTQLSVSFRPER